MVNYWLSSNLANNQLISYFPKPLQKSIPAGTAAWKETLGDRSMEDDKEKSIGPTLSWIPDALSVE